VVNIGLVTVFFHEDMRQGAIWAVDVAEKLTCTSYRYLLGRIWGIHYVSK